MRVQDSELGQITGRQVPNVLKFSNERCYIIAKRVTIY